MDMDFIMKFTLTSMDMDFIPKRNQILVLEKSISDL